jgi:hypothetical protein
VRAAILTLLLILAAPALARAQDADRPPDYEVTSTAWNGLSTFGKVVDGLGLELRVVSSLEWSEIDAEDILVLVWPLRHVESVKVANFVHAGGHVVIADDFGEAGEAMNRLGLLRADVGAARSKRYHEGRMWAPIADVLARHPITDGVDEVVCNHPAVLTDVSGADALVGFPGGDAVVVAGQRGTGRFVVVSDPSIFINRMQQFPGNLTLTANMLRWLDRGGRARRVILLVGDVPMYGDPKPFIDDAGASPFDRKIHGLNSWLEASNDWLLTVPAMRVVGGLLAALLLVVAFVTLPAWRKNQADGRWLRVDRPARKDDLERAVEAADGGSDNFVIAATVLRDLAQLALQRVTGTPDPLFSLGEAELVQRVSAVKGPQAGAALARVHRRLRGLPSRTQAAAPWSGTHVARRDFEQLHDDVMALYESLDGEAPRKREAR